MIIALHRDWVLRYSGELRSKLPGLGVCSALLVTRHMAGCNFAASHNTKHI